MKQIKLLMILVVTFFYGGVTANLNGQNVVRQGKTFVVESPAAPKSSKTEYVYKDAKGVSYPIYLSSGGKAYIIKISKKTGKEYRQYLPEIGRQINPDAYKDNPNTNNKK